MNQQLAHVTLLVKDYGEAFEIYTKKLHFGLIEDTLLNETTIKLIMKPNILYFYSKPNIYLINNR
jgi:catechol 2,3-dioxygenase-like lactoylglutathione lyase family enzyme